MSACAKRGRLSYYSKETNVISPDLEHLAVAISSLKGEPRNARQHDERNLQALMGSLREFGQQKPVIALVDGTVIAGNGTMEAAKRLEWTHLAVVRFADVEKARAFAIADNRTAELSSWDTEILAETLRELRDGDFDIDDVGFSSLELDRMLDVRGADGKPLDPKEEWKGMPEFDQPDRMAERRLIVNFRSEADVAAFCKLIGQQLTEKTRSIWFPEAEGERHITMRYEADAEP